MPFRTGEVRVRECRHDNASKANACWLAPWPTAVLAATAVAEDASVAELHIRVLVHASL